MQMMLLECVTHIPKKNTSYKPEALLGIWASLEFCLLLFVKYELSSLGFICLLSGALVTGGSCCLSFSQRKMDAHLYVTVWRFSEGLWCSPCPISSHLLDHCSPGKRWAGKTGAFGLHSGQAHREGSWRTHLLYFTHSSFAIKNLCKKPPWPAPHTYRRFYLIHLGDIHAHLSLDSQMASSSLCRLGYRFTQVETCVNRPSLKPSTCVKDSSA